jgi:hypothetical protein
MLFSFLGFASSNLLISASKFAPELLRQPQRQIREEHHDHQCEQHDATKGMTDA